MALLAPNTPEAFECAFGVPMLGAVLNANNTRLDAGTIAYILEHGEAKVFLVDTELSATARDALARNPSDVADVDGEAALRASRAREFDARALDDSFAANSQIVIAC